MRQHPLRSLAAASALALALGLSGGAAWAQAAATTDQPAATADQPAATTDQAAPAANDNAAPAATTDQAAPSAGTERGTDGAAPATGTDQAAPGAAVDTTAAPGAEGGATEGAAAPGQAAPSDQDAQPAPTPDASGVPPLAGGNDLPVIGAPHQAGTGFQPASTKVAADLQWLDGMLIWIVTPIVILVVALLAWVILRFNQRVNKTPASFTHNSPLEVAWTIVPIVILIFIGAFSLPVLFEEQEIPEGDIHIKATGYQWYWHYDYLDDAVSYDAYMIGYGQGQMTAAEDDPVRVALKDAGYDPSLYKLASDNAVVVPVGATVVVTVTGGDVIHSWKVPAFGVMQDGVPGRLAQTWFKAEKEGIFFGQCSELCGKDHAFMPITVRVVSPEEYQSWLAHAKVDFAA